MALHIDLSGRTALVTGTREGCARYQKSKTKSTEVSRAIEIRQEVLTREHTTIIQDFLVRSCIKATEDPTY